MGPLCLLWSYLTAAVHHCCITQMCASQILHLALLAHTFYPVDSEADIISDHVGTLKQYLRLVTTCTMQGVA
jgi:hypothetical protein